MMTMIGASLFFAGSMCLVCQGQKLDPTQDRTGAVLESSIHKPLPEEYIWTARALDGDVVSRTSTAAGQTEEHAFRHEFDLDALPKHATLYVAIPRSAKIYINGQIVDEVSSDPSSPLDIHVFMTDVNRTLRPGRNLIAIDVVQGRSWRGKRLVAKIVPAAMGVNAKPIMKSDGSWKSAINPAPGWEKVTFDDTGWKPVESLGGIESSIEMFQGNIDAGMYDWPGYDGISPFLAHIKLPAQKVVWTFKGRSKFTNEEALTGGPGDFAVDSAPVRGDEGAPSMLLDFGEELTGRLEVESDTDMPVTVSIQYGESESEALKSPYLGMNVLTVPPHGTGYGPKTAFRYVKVRFLTGGQELRFKSIHVDDIFYPVKYLGSFESSDPQLNKIWEVGAYTVHLCMQDGLWDAPKRDRRRWIGDIDVSGRTVNNVFGDHYLMEDTLERLIGNGQVKSDVNGIPGYSSFWFTAAAAYYRHTGSKAFLEKTHDQAVQLLQHVDAEFDERNLYANKRKSWLFVDWSPELNGDTPESRKATDFEFYRAYREGAWLLRQMGDNRNADFYDQRAVAIKTAANKYLLDPATGTYGPRWQTNAMAVLSGIAGPEQYDAIWKNVLSQVGHVKYNPFMISPYYNYYVISAMAKMGHQKEALDWIRQYWGGMINEGATSFWEAYDPSWPKRDFHAALESDDGTGYFVSLSHGWSSGPTAWLMEEMLGIHVTGAGFSAVDIAPDLMGLEWAKGTEPTPDGLLKVDVRKGTIMVDVPEGVEARVLIPVSWGDKNVWVNGKASRSTSSVGDARQIVVLRGARHYLIEER
jgi:hypothetical protein